MNLCKSLSEFVVFKVCSRLNRNRERERGRMLPGKRKLWWPKVGAVIAGGGSGGRLLWEQMRIIIIILFSRSTKKKIWILLFVKNVYDRPAHA